MEVTSRPLNSVQINFFDELSYRLWFSIVGDFWEGEGLILFQIFPKMSLNLYSAPAKDLQEVFSALLDIEIPIINSGAEL